MKCATWSLNLWVKSAARGPFHLGGERYLLATQFFSVRVFLDCMTPSYESRTLPAVCDFFRTDFFGGTMIPRLNDAATWRLIMRAAVLPIMLLALLMPQRASTQEQSDQLGQEGMSMSMEKPQDSAQLAKLLADKRESEFNHRLAGVFVIVAGVFMLFHENIEKRLPSAKYVWPATFLVSGVFLLGWSDTELWPFGNRQWLEALSNNRSATAQDIRCSPVGARISRVVARQRNTQSGLESLGLPCCGNRRLYPASISRTRGRNARGKSHGGDGTDQE